LGPRVQGLGLRVGNTPSPTVSFQEKERRVWTERRGSHALEKELEIADSLFRLV